MLVPCIFFFFPFSCFFFFELFYSFSSTPSSSSSQMLFAQNINEVRFIARELARRASRVTPAGAMSAASRAAADVARFPATLAESFGRALVPGGWMHDAVSVTTAEIVSYPAALVSGVAASTRRLASQAAALDAKGIYADVVREFTEFPRLLASAVGPLFRDFAPLGTVLAELFIGPAPLKGHGVPDLADFARTADGTAGVGGGKFGFEDDYDFGPNLGGAPGRGGGGGGGGSGFSSTLGLGLGGLPSIVGVPGGRLARVDENATLAEDDVREVVGGARRGGGGGGGAGIGTGSTPPPLEWDGAGEAESGRRRGRTRESV